MLKRSSVHDNTSALRYDNLSRNSCINPKTKERNCKLFVFKVSHFLMTYCDFRFMFRVGISHGRGI